jgi:hypothetical protein
MSVVVNCLGGPGVGKSVLAAELFIKMKKLGVCCELVTEYPKELVWEENHRAIRDQLYVFATQAYRQELLRDKVDVIVTDSPLLLSCIYNRDQTSPVFKRLVMERFNTYRNVNFLIQRSAVFEQTGRIHNLEESTRLDREIKNWMVRYKIKFTRVWVEKYDLDSLVNQILKFQRESG